MRLYKTYIKKRNNGGPLFDSNDPWYDINGFGLPKQDSSKLNLGTMGQGNVGSILGAAVPLATSFIPDKNANLGYYENYHTDYATAGMKGALNGGVAGFQAAGPVGALAGAAIGGITSVLGSKKREKEHNKEVSLHRNMFRDNVTRGQQFDAYNNKNYFNDSRQAQLYGNGGSLVSNYMANQKATGGTLTPMSNNTTEVQGPSHENGGVQLPGQNAEVEGGETLAKDYVFSKQLGFAKLHKPIAKAKGKIEDKPATAERLNALKRLEEKEEKLKLSQEFIKKQLNLQ